MSETYLDDEEKDLIETYNSIPISENHKPTQVQQAKFKQAAKSFLKQEKKMNIRIDEQELERIKEFANREGLRYQTFIKSVIHRYITGQLVEKKKAEF